MNIVYRKLQPGDSGIYREIRLESLKNDPDGFGSSYEDEVKAAKLGYETYIEEQTAGRFVFGAFDDEKLIGICGYYQETSKKIRHRGTIIQMYVNRNYRGQKIGRTLLEKTIAEAFANKEVELLVLGVVTENKSAHFIYEQAGFKEYGLLRNLLKEGDKYFDERLMVLYRSL